MLKSHLAEGKEIKFHPHEDDWFYDQQIRSRRIMSEIKKILSLQALNQNDDDTAKKVSDLTQRFLRAGNKFLNLRNKTIHHLFSPKEDMEKIENEIEETISTYHQFMKLEVEFFELLQPYRFSESEIKYFYGNSNKS